MPGVKYMNIKIPVQYDNHDMEGKKLEKFIEVTGDPGTSISTGPILPKHTNLKRVDSAALYWHEGSDCVTFKMGNIIVTI